MLIGKHKRLDLSHHKKAVYQVEPFEVLAGSYIFKTNHIRFAHFDLKSKFLV